MGDVATRHTGHIGGQAAGRINLMGAGTPFGQIATGRGQTALHGLDVPDFPQLANPSYIRFNDVVDNRWLMPAHAEVCESCRKMCAEVAGIKAVKQNMRWQDCPQADRRWREVRLSIPGKDDKPGRNIWFCGACAADAGKMRSALMQVGGTAAAYCGNGKQVDYPAVIAALVQNHLNYAKIARTHPGVETRFGMPHRAVDGEFKYSLTARVDTYNARKAQYAEKPKQAKVAPAKQEKPVKPTADKK